MAPKRAPERKRQTRLNFTPTEKSTPRRRKIARALSLSDDDDSPIPAAKRRKIETADNERGMRLGMPVHHQAHGMFGSSDVDLDTSDSSEEDSDSRGEVLIISSRRKRGRAKEPEPEPELDPSNDEEKEQVRPRRIGRRRARRPTTPEDGADEGGGGDDSDNGGADEDDDLKEDLAFLRSSPLPDRGRLRSTQDKPMNQRQKALEALKKRRAGNQEPSSSATPGRSRPVIIDSDSDSDLEIIREEQEDSASADGDPEEESEDGEEQTNAYDMFQEHVDDDDFIVDDADDPIGAPAGDHSMPLEFTGLSSAKPKELFKYAVEWMVQKKINPAFSNDEIYDLAFRKLDDEVKGLANSKFTSSAWTSDFSRAIRARPEMISNEIPQGRKEVFGQHCEACNRKNHPASWEVAFVGKPYSRDTLEPLADDTDSSGDSDSNSDSSSLSADSETELNGEKPTYNATGERIPPESKIFTLGSTCKANAQVAHTLHHWRHHLNVWVVDYLVREGHCTPEMVVKRDKWSVKKRDKLARKIVRKMEESGEVKKLHHLYKEQVKFAAEVNNDFNRGWGRR